MHSNEQPVWYRHFEPDELLGRYVPIQELGRGAESTNIVYEGKLLKTWGKLQPGMKVAIKKKKRVFHALSGINGKRLLRELRILRILRNHDNIVTLYDIIPPKNPTNFSTLSLVFEYVDADLSKIFRSNQFFSTLHVQFMLYQILLAMKYMHSANIVHRNLKPANILINFEDCSIRICDFSLARGFSNVTDDEKDNSALLNKRRASHFVVLNQSYRAPEVILLQQTLATLYAADMWSIGAIFAELLQMQRENQFDVGKRGPIFPPLTDQFEVTDEKCNKYIRQFPQMFPGADKHALDLLSRLLKFDVSKRLSANQALQHPYFKSVRDSVYERSKKPVTFSFESAQLNERQFRELILEEVIKYNKLDEKRLVESGAMPNYKRMMEGEAKKIPFLVNGYIRLNIHMQIPVGLVDIIQLIYKQMFYTFLT